MDCMGLDCPPSFSVSIEAASASDLSYCKTSPQTHFFEMMERARPSLAAVPAFPRICRLGGRRALDFSAADLRKET